MDSLPANIVDLVVIAVVLISGIWAFFRGLVHEVLAIAAWIGAILVAIYGFPYAQPYMRELIDMKLVADLVTGAVLFIVSLVLLSLITRTLSRLVKGSALNALDRSLGFLFGLLRGAVLVSLAWLLAGWIAPEKDYPHWIMEAKTLPLIRTGADYLERLAPGTLVAGAAREDEQGASPDRGEEIDTFKRLTSPPRRAGPEGTAPEGGGYGPQERRGMDRLIQGAQ